MLSTWSLPSSDGSTNAIDERDCGPSCLTLLVIVFVLVRRSEADCWSFDLERAVRVLDGWGYHSVVFKPARAKQGVEGRLVGNAGQLAVADLDPVEHGRVEQPAGLVVGPVGFRNLGRMR